MPATTTIFTTHGELGLLAIIMFIFAVVAGAGVVVLVLSFLPRLEWATERRKQAFLVSVICGVIALGLLVVLSLSGSR